MTEPCPSYKLYTSLQQERAVRRGCDVQCPAGLCKGYGYGLPGLPGLLRQPGADGGGTAAAGCFPEQCVGTRYVYQGSQPVCGSVQKQKTKGVSMKKLTPFPGEIFSL